MPRSLPYHLTHSPLVLAGDGVTGKPRPEWDSSGPWAAGSSEAVVSGWDGKNRTQAVPVGAIDSPGSGVKAEPPRAPGSGRWETHHAGHLGSGSRARSWGRGLWGRGRRRACSQAALRTRALAGAASCSGAGLSATRLALAALIPLLPTCSPEIRTQLQTQIKELQPHKSGRIAVGTQPRASPALPRRGKGRPGWEYPGKHRSRRDPSLASWPLTREAEAGGLP